MAHITSGFSFAFLQECFIATLLILARDEDEELDASENDDLDDYELWRAFKQQADILRKEVEGQKTKPSQLMEWCRNAATADHIAGSPETTSTQCGRCAHCPMDRGDAPSQSTLPNLQQLDMKEEVLRALPYQYQKIAMINGTAFEYRER